MPLASPDTATVDTSTAIARRLLYAIVSRDHVVAAFQGWFGAALELQVLLASTDSVGTREHLTYRLRLRPGWAPDVWHVIEQTGYARVREGRVRRIDLVCTGFVPEADLARRGQL